MKKERKRIHLRGFWQWIICYCMVPIYLVVPLMSIKGIYDIYTGKYTGTRTVEEFLFVGILFLAAAILFYIFRWRLLYFKEIKIQCTNKDFKDAAQRTIDELDLQVEYNKNNKLKGSYSQFGLDRWIISIEKDENIIYFNSMPDPDGVPAAFSFGRNKRNRIIFLQNLNNVLIYIPQKTISKEKEKKEWGIKRVLTRLFMYPFCIFLLGIGTHALLNPTSWKSPLVGIGTFIIAALYLYADLKIIFGKKKK